ncbi:L-rhamnose mutarotase [Maribacter sp. 4G9]|uniref:L-rhamnose mutarotase n=1 Tax=Maribacter sp. 4G9 TaxID=1889777 RepID=UPI000C14CE7B|nr:L-rhamnose mutarotase [Maribacter sp. 4G9]PIB28958.1 L-fucose mutarotase [Maribacter sp. 4G9]
MKRFCFACDLKNDLELIESYKNYHKKENTWPEITKSIKDAGVLDMEIYLVGNRLFLVMEVDETFSFDRKKRMDAENPKVQDWEQLMWKFQQALPNTPSGEKWTPTELIFKLG